MSASTDPGDYRDRLDLAELGARIERTNAETRKVLEEAPKLAAQREKLAAEARKLDRDRSIAPLLPVVAALGAAIASIPVPARLFGMVWPSP